MRKLNNKGFTLVELIATIVILAVVVGIGSYAITSLISSSKEKDYELLIKEIKNAVELYYQECKFSVSDDDLIVCPVKGGDGYYSLADFDGDGTNENLTLEKLITYGFLKGNSTITDEGDNKDKGTLVNPNNNNLISDCVIKYKYESGKIEVLMVSQNSTNSCPTSY